MISLITFICIIYMIISISVSILLFKCLPSVSYKNARDCIDVFLLSIQWPGSLAVVIILYLYFKVIRVLKEKE